MCGQLAFGAGAQSKERRQAEGTLMQRPSSLGEFPAVAEPAGEIEEEPERAFLAGITCLRLQLQEVELRSILPKGNRQGTRYGRVFARQGKSFGKNVLTGRRGVSFDGAAAQQWGAVPRQPSA